MFHSHMLFSVASHALFNSSASILMDVVSSFYCTSVSLETLISSEAHSDVDYIPALSRSR